MSFLYFLITFFLGLGLIVYREKVQRFTGSIGFAEEYLGAGGTYNLYLLLGILFMVGSILYITGTLDSAIESSIGRFIIIR